MTAKQLLQDLETLTYEARIRHMIELGRNAAHDAQLAATLTALEKGNFYARFLAIHTCFGSYNASHVLRALADPSRIIRGVALNLVVLTCNEQQLQDALTIVPHDGRLPLLWKLHHGGYGVLIDAFLEQLAATNDPQLQKLLPSGSPTLVRRFIARFLHKMELVDWRRLARRHATIAFELLQARAETTTTLDLQLLSFVNSILPILANKQPDHALTLVETMAHSVSLNRLNLQALVLQRPEKLVDLMAQGGDLGSVELGVIAVNTLPHKLDHTHFHLLLEIYPDIFLYFKLQLRKITLAKRPSLYAILSPLWHDRYGYVEAYIIALLPRVQREQEARRHLALSTLATRPEERFPYAAFLPWDEARTILDPFLHDPRMTTRIAVLHTFIRLARYERNHIADMLAIIQGHLNDPDPVRAAMLNELAELPRSLWRPDYLAAIEQIITTTINTFDTSAFTIGSLSLLIIRFLDCAPEWSARQLSSIVQVRGLTFNYGCIENKLSDADVRLIGPALQPIFLSWAEHKNEKALEAAYSLFGKRVRVFDALLDALDQFFHHGSSFQFGDTILSTIIQYRPIRAAQLIPALLQGDPNWITYPAVSAYLYQYRQDLLTPFLSQRKYSQVFTDANSSDVRERRRFAHPLTRGFARWTFHQQSLFARTLLKEINDESSSHQVLIQSITQLAALPAIPVKPLIALASSQRPIVRDTALLLLRKLDAGQGIPSLLEALQDQRAARAIYALRPFLLSIPAQQALAILHTIPFTKVTTAKEVVRLMGELSGEEAYQALLALDRQDLHRDVRAAYLSILWHHLERDETWHILERDAQSADIIIALSTVHLNVNHIRVQADQDRKRFRRVRYDYLALYRFSWLSEWNTLTMTSLSGEHLSLKAQHRLMRLFAALLARPELFVRSSVLKCCTRLATADNEQLLLSRLLEVMNSDNEDTYTFAARVIFGTCIPSDAPHIAQAIQHLLPNRRTLQAILRVLQEAVFTNKRQLLPTVKAILEVLATDPITIEQRIELAIALLPWSKVAPFLEHTLIRGELHAGAVNRACEMLHEVAKQQDTHSRPDIKDMFHLEKALVAHPDERLRRIALAALIAQTSFLQSWNDEQRARLQTYRADPSLLVATTGQFTFPPNAI